MTPGTPAPGPLPVGDELAHRRHRVADHLAGDAGADQPLSRELTAPARTFGDMSESPPDEASAEVAAGEVDAEAEAEARDDVEAEAAAELDPEAEGEE